MLNQPTDHGCLKDTYLLLPFRVNPPTGRACFCFDWFCWDALPVDCEVVLVLLLFVVREVAVVGACADWRLEVCRLIIGRLLEDDTFCRPGFDCDTVVCVGWRLDVCRVEAFERFDGVLLPNRTSLVLRPFPPLLMNPLLLVEDGLLFRAVSRLLGWRLLMVTPELCRSCLPEVLNSLRLLSNRWLPIAKPVRQ